MKNKTKNTPIVKVVDGVQHINLGTIDLEKQYGNIPSTLSGKLAEEIDEVNNYLLDLQMLIGQTSTKLTIWRFTKGGVEVEEKYNDAAKKLYYVFNQLLGMTPDILTKTAKVYKFPNPTQEMSILDKVKKCFQQYDELHQKALQEVDKNKHIFVLGCDSGCSPTLDNATVISSHKANASIPNNLFRLILNLGDLLKQWELYRGDERIDDGSLSAVFTKNPQDSIGLQEDVLRSLRGKPTGKLVTSIHHILSNKKAINCSLLEFVHRLRKHGINIKYNTATKYNDEFDLDCFNSTYL